MQGDLKMTETETKQEKKTGLNIRIGDDYIITSDSYQYIINKIGFNKVKKEETISPVAYFGLHSFNLAKDYMIKHIALNSGELKTIDQLNEALKTAKSEVDTYME